MKKTIKQSFEEARTFVHSLHLKDTYEWFAYSKSSKRPNDIPGSPANYYRKSGWVSWYDWLGKAHSRKNKYRPFEEARIFVRSLGLRTQEEWVKYYKSGKRPKDIPSAPSLIYKDKGWKSIKDWLGTENAQGSKYRSFESAREFSRSLGFQNQKDWVLYSKSGKRPKDIPSSPFTIYKDKGWKSMKDWLGAENSSHSKYRSFEAARNFVHSLGLKNQQDWNQYSKSGKRPKDIPSSPNIIFKGIGWISWTDWRGS